MADVARFSYATGHRSNEIRKLCWSHLDDDAIDDDAIRASGNLRRTEKMIGLRQRAVQDKRREWKQAQAEKVVTMPKRAVQ
jgi:hypothetical protein